jgi:hypothetical protein
VKKSGILFWLYQIFFFSDYFNRIGRSLVFAITVFIRLVLILISFSKRIIPVNFDYFVRPVFQNSFIVVTYKFKNALWYEIRPGYKTINKRRMILDLNNIHGGLQFIIYGFFTKHKYPINLPVKTILKNQSFNTITTIPTTPLVWHNKTPNYTPLFSLSEVNPRLKTRTINIKLPLFNLIHNAFIKTDYL